MRAQRLIKLMEMYAENSRDTFVLFALGMEHLGVNNLDQAELFFTKCLEVDEGYIPALYQMAILLNNRGLEEESLRLLDRGLLLLKGGNDQKTLNEFRSLKEEISF